MRSCPSSSPAALALGLALALVARPALGQTERDAPPQEGSSSRMAWQAALSSSVGFDSNARRQYESGEVTGDALAYLVASGRVDSRDDRRLLTFEGDIGGKLFHRTPAEDTIAGKLSVRRLSSPRPGLMLGLDAQYKDRLQRGDPWEDVDHLDHLACRPPEGPAGRGYRCNRRDYRQLSLGGSLEARLGDWAVRGRVGPTLLDYKPNRQFSYIGPQAGVSASRALGEAHTLRFDATGTRRYYHPRSTTYRLLPGQEGFALDLVARPRVEQVIGAALSWRYRGPVLLSTGLSVASSRSNSFGMDSLRGRAEISGGVRLGAAATLVGSAAFQIAHYPEGNVFRHVTQPMDEEERQSFVGLQVTRRVGERLSLVLKAQWFANEMDDDAPRFRRGLVQGGARWSL